MVKPSMEFREQRHHALFVGPLQGSFEVLEKAKALGKSAFGSQFSIAEKFLSMMCV